MMRCKKLPLTRKQKVKQMLPADIFIKPPVMPNIIERSRASSPNKEHIKRIVIIRVREVVDNIMKWRLPADFQKASGTFSR